ncbi:hypothetical protein PPYR_12302 [Photinus pyralis]|uniref:Uncharacterized protein n=1 Tax=Photinus pyralis TaxID=7054 RepID=A0A5N4ADR0_PHOPY|nr:hypothetical protein PPYR_12302 [Photinus pyralis]
MATTYSMRLNRRLMEHSGLPGEKRGVQQDDLRMRNESECKENNKWPEIIRCEVERAINDLKDKKAIGCDAVDEIGTGLLYKNIPDCFRKIWKTEGVFGFYKGLTAHYMRLGPHGGLTLVFWDSLKDLQKTFQSKHQIS